jgi:hypothetical protein
MADDTLSPSLHIPELVHEILIQLDLDSVEDARTLWICGHVSRIFRQTARSLSYHSLTLYDEKPERYQQYRHWNQRRHRLRKHYSFQEFDDLLSQHPAESPDVVQFVKDLHIKISNEDFSSSICLTEEPHDSAIEASSKKSIWGSTPNLHVLTRPAISVLTQLQVRVHNLERLTISLPGREIWGQRSTLSFLLSFLLRSDSSIAASLKHFRLKWRVCPLLSEYVRQIQEWQRLYVRTGAAEYIPMMITSLSVSTNSMETGDNGMWFENFTYLLRETKGSVKHLRFCGILVLASEFSLLSLSLLFLTPPLPPITLVT